MVLPSPNKRKGLSSALTHEHFQRTGGTKLPQTQKSLPRVLLEGPFKDQDSFQTTALALKFPLLSCQEQPPRSSNPNNPNFAPAGAKPPISCSKRLFPSPGPVEAVIPWVSSTEEPPAGLFHGEEKRGDPQGCAPSGMGLALGSSPGIPEVGSRGAWPKPTAELSKSQTSKYLQPFLGQLGRLTREGKELSL